MSMQPTIRGVPFVEQVFGPSYWLENQNGQVDHLEMYNEADEKVNTTHVDLVTEKLRMYIDKENKPLLREYGLLSELRHPSGRHRSRAGKHKTVHSCTAILQRPREDQRSFCTRECNK